MDAKNKSKQIKVVDKLGTINRNSSIGKIRRAHNITNFTFNRSGNINSNANGSSNNNNNRKSSTGGLSAIAKLRLKKR